MIPLHPAAGVIRGGCRFRSTAVMQHLGYNKSIPGDSTDQSFWGAILNTLNLF